MRYVAAILLGRCVRALARLRRPGGGSAVPGLVVNALAPGYLARALASFPQGLVVVSGSAGKSTTTKMLVAMLRAHGLCVFTNPSTANISQGLTSALLEEANVLGRVSADIAVLEMDEGHGARLAPDMRPRVVVLTNVLTDQIDRFHDSDEVARMLRTMADRATETVVVNGDDALVSAIGDGVDVAVCRFGFCAELQALTGEMGYARGQQTSSQTPLDTEVVRVQDRSATIRVSGEPIDVALPARGAHFAIDAAAALEAAHTILGPVFDSRKAKSTLDAMPPVFGRGEIVTVAGQHIEFVLVQNTASFQLNIDTLPTDIEPPLVAIGSDVRDPSYLWPVNVTRLTEVAIASGTQAFEIALQLEYQGVHVQRVEPNLSTAVDDFLAAPPPKHGVKTIIFSADSMRRVRAHLGLTDPKGRSVA